VDNVDLFSSTLSATSKTSTAPRGRAAPSKRPIQAKEEGLVGAIGITATERGPGDPPEALRRYPFETVLTPWNYILSTDESYRADYEALVDEVKRQDVGLMIIKTISRRNWPEGDPTAATRSTRTWYEPFRPAGVLDAGRLLGALPRRGHGLAMVGDVTLVPMMLEPRDAACRARRPKRSSRVLPTTHRLSSRYRFRYLSAVSFSSPYRRRLTADTTGGVCFAEGKVRQDGSRDNAGRIRGLGDRRGRLARRVGTQDDDEAVGL
jgi:hypothetical protein